MMTDSENVFLQTLLEKANFYPLEVFDSDDAFNAVKTWLLEVGSLTQRFEALNRHITVVPHFEHFIDSDSHLEAALDTKSACFWQRDITLYANDEPWLIARTLVPKEALIDEYERLIDLGTIPLGKYLFSHPTLKRTQLEIAKIILNRQDISNDLCQQLFNDDQQKALLELDNQYVCLWARRSILKINQSRLLLSELFLPKSPTYIPFYVL